MAKQNVSILGIWAVILATICHFYIRQKLSGIAAFEQRRTGNATDSRRLHPAQKISSLPIHEPSPKLRILSYDPFIAHIEDFVSETEREYLIQYSKPLLSRSTIVDDDGNLVESSGRTSSTAFLPQNDLVVTTILKRAAEFQGYLPIKDMEMQVTSYQQGQEYFPHFDWFIQPGLTENRLSSFFAILDSNCENCGTQFPNIQVNWTERDQRLCKFVDCGQNLFTTKPVIGSAIYWRNLDEYGRGRYDSMHAGLPLSSGTKVGLNIWTSVKLST